MKISNHSFPPGFFLQLKPHHTACIIVFQSAVRLLIHFHFPFPNSYKGSTLKLKLLLPFGLLPWQIACTVFSGEKKTLVWLMTALTETDLFQLFSLVPIPSSISICHYLYLFQLHPKHQIQDWILNALSTVHTHEYKDFCRYKNANAITSITLKVALINMVSHLHFILIQCVRNNSQHPRLAVGWEKQHVALLTETEYWFSKQWKKPNVGFGVALFVCFKEKNINKSTILQLWFRSSELLYHII